MDTTWTLKHPLVEAAQQIGERGIVMAEAADPLCIAASLFSMENYTVMALTDQSRFHALLRKVSRAVYLRTEYIAANFPGHIFRICGPEYATEPYLPPHLFREYVNEYTGPMVDMIHRHTGYVRLHCHGRIASALPAIVDMGVDAIDPIEPPSQGDVELSAVAAEYGDTLSLFGNIEVSDVENLNEIEFAEKVNQSLDAGSKARGHVLMPTASPYGREVAPRTMRNYETMVRLVNERT